MQVAPNVWIVASRHNCSIICVGVLDSAHERVTFFVELLVCSVGLCSLKRVLMSCSLGFACLVSYALHYVVLKHPQCQCLRPQAQRISRHQKLARLLVASGMRKQQGLERRRQRPSHKAKHKRYLQLQNLWISPR